MKYKIHLLILFFGLFVNIMQGQITERLEGLPPLKDWFLSTGEWQNDPQLYIRELGSGQDTVVMLHGGWGGEHGGLIQSVASLKDQYRFIFYDQRGSLRSPFPDSLITFRHHINDLELLRKELKLNKFTLVAHSMGTVLASAYAQEYPDRIEQLILLAPAPLKNPIPEEDIALQQQAGEKHQAFMNRPEVQQEFTKYGLIKEDTPLSSRENTANFRINFSKRMLYDIRKWPKLSGGRAMYKGHVFGLTANSYPKEGWDYFEVFKKGGYPVNIIVGDHDFLDMGNQLIKKWTTGNTRLNLKIIENAGHIIWLDQPKLFETEVRNYLKSKRNQEKK